MIPSIVLTVPSDALLKTMNILHRSILKMSAGKKGWNAGNMPVLKLTTTGRKSGAPRMVMLTSPIQHGDCIVIVASRGGDDQHPAWLLNLRENPIVEVQTKELAKHKRQARIANATERAVMWPIIIQKYKGYAAYQGKTEREIPLVLLDPIV